ncbi:MAG: RDD family protein [Cellulomonadaceae bacterium]|jgi:uncharacterized RDD family membrane protein YckC|nr:RDD family protein [Cellulomonadaceae bacterium]
MDDGIIIGEGVMLDVRPASFITRSLGWLVDAVALGVTAFLLLLLVISLTSDAGDVLFNDHWQAVGSITIVAVLLVGVPAFVETMSRGRSLGKLATGTRVVRDDGGPIRLRHALIRALVGVGELWLTGGSVALIVSMVNGKGKRLGDLVAGTCVIRVRGAQDRRVVLTMPPQLAAWASTADMARLPDGLALAARRLLDRAPRLAPASRISLTDEIAGRVEPYVAPAPPPGTHPEAFLHAVLYTRRDRELAAATASRERGERLAHAIRQLPYGLGDLSA